VWSCKRSDEYQQAHTREQDCIHDHPSTAAGWTMCATVEVVGCCEFAFGSCAAMIAARGTYLSSCAITRDSAVVNWHHVRLKAMVNLDSAVIKAAYLLSRLPDQMACPAAQE